MEDIIKILHEGNYSCVVSNAEGIHTFSEGGIADLYDMVKNKPQLLNEARIADKVIGKGAVALITLGGVAEVYADIISLSALALLQEANIKTNFAYSVPSILNRSQTDLCPLESLCYKESSIAEIMRLIEIFIFSKKTSVITN